MITFDSSLHAVGIQPAGLQKVAAHAADQSNARAVRGSLSVSANSRTGRGSCSVHPSSPGERAFIARCSQTFNQPDLCEHGSMENYSTSARHWPRAARTRCVSPGTRSTTSKQWSIALLSAGSPPAHALETRLKPPCEQETAGFISPKKSTACGPQPHGVNVWPARIIRSAVLRNSSPAYSRLTHPKALARPVMDSAQRESLTYHLSSQMSRPGLVLAASFLGHVMEGD